MNYDCWTCLDTGTVPGGLDPQTLGRTLALCGNRNCKARARILDLKTRQRDAGNAPRSVKPDITIDSYVM